MLSLQVSLKKTNGQLGHLGCSSANQQKREGERAFPPLTGAGIRKIKY